MDEHSRVTSKVKVQISRYTNRLTVGLPKPTRKFVGQMIYGIQAAKDVKLSNVCRALCESIRLIKTENRLSHQINRRDLTPVVNRSLLGEAKVCVERDMVLAVDLSDVQKVYAKKMEHLAQVWDGSKGRVGQGYWWCEVMGAAIDGDRLVPLYGELYSQEADDFESENEQILKAVDEVRAQVGGRGIWAIDRGGDRFRLIYGLLQREQRFVVRLVGQRHLVLSSGERRVVTTIARRIRCRETHELEIDREGYREVKTIRLGSRLVQLPGVGQWFRLVVIKGFGEKPMMLLTNVDGPIRRILEIYLTRWKCEESFRFLKQVYRVEDVRVRGYVGLRNTIALVQAVFYFLCVELAQKQKLNILLTKLYEKAKRFFEIPAFKYYAIADGIYRVLFRSGWDLSAPKPPPRSPQLTFRFLTANH